MSTPQAVIAAALCKEIEALRDAGFHVISNPESAQAQGDDHGIVHSLTAYVDGQILQATLVEQLQRDVAEREVTRTALGVSFAVGLGKRLGVIPAAFAAPKER